MVALQRPVSKKKTTNRAPQGPPVRRLFAVGRAYASTCLWELRDRKTEATGYVGVPSRCKIRFVLDNTKTALFSDREEDRAPSSWAQKRFKEACACLPDASATLPQPRSCNTKTQIGLKSVSCSLTLVSCYLKCKSHVRFV